MVSLLSRSVRPFLVAGALAEGVDLAAGGAGLGVVELLFLPFPTTVAQEGAPTGAGAGGGGAGSGVVVDGPEVDTGAFC